MDYSKLSEAELDKLVQEKAAKQASSAPDYENMSDDELDKLVMAKASAEAPKTKASKVQTGLESFGNAATLGYLPQLQAATYPAFEAVLNKVTGKNVQSNDTYVQRRDENIKRQQKQAEENPKSALAGMIAGTIAGGAALPVGKVVQAKSFFPAWQTAKQAATIGRGAQAALVGAGLGAVANPGDVEGEVSPLQLQDRIENAKTGALTGAVLQGGFEAASGLAKKVASLPQTLKSYAEEKAFKATGANKRDFIKALGKDKVGEIGRVMIDEGIVQPGSSLDDIAEAAIELKQKTGQKIGSMVKQLAKDEPLYGGIPISRKDIAKELSDDLMVPSSLPGVAEKNSKMQTLINEFVSAKEPLTIDELQKIKNHLGDPKSRLIKWDRVPTADIPEDEQFYRALYNKISKAQESKALQIAENSGLNEYKDLKKLYGAAATIEDITSRSLAGQKANRLFSPSDMFSGGIGAAAGFASGDSIEEKLKNAAIGASAGLVNKVGRRYGNPVLTFAADKSAQILQRNPWMLGPYAVPLTEALKQGPGVYNATLGKLLSDKQFVARLESVNEEELASQAPATAIQRELIKRQNQMGK